MLPKLRGTGRTPTTYAATETDRLLGSGIFTDPGMVCATMTRPDVETDDPESETEAVGTLPKPGVYCGTE
ncbi:hypothetical protein C450_04913 [Halococcus salifodinae DSM 8989]|uniref:Uncharacterized protein n=1 Tax=Halococcus salifodinae DSM 8989 TaxID=1227456 RepID=M0N9Y8_9EURY|nr:hypothetical protein C450_04913 [Halococcus salifodinae DSM 8989]